MGNVVLAVVGSCTFSLHSKICTHSRHPRCSSLHYFKKKMGLRAQRLRNNLPESAAVVSNTFVASLGLRLRIEMMNFDAQVFLELARLLQATFHLVDTPFDT